MSKRNLLSATAALTVLLPAAHALAQQQAQIGLEEITVTARRVEENLMQVPLAISAVTAADIENAGMKTLIDLGRFTPGLFASVSGNGRTDRSNTKLTFRGLSVASGLTFIDGAPYTGSKTPDITDVARVEVLKGPQAVYFGRSTYSGAVNYVLREPADEFRGRVQGEYKSFNGYEGVLTLEGPIAKDKLGFRVSFDRYFFGGQYRNPRFGNMLGQESTTAVNMYLSATPSDNFKAKFYAAWSLDDDGTPTEAVLLARKIFPDPANPQFNALTTLRGGELQCNLGGTGGPYWCGQLSSITTYLKDNPMLISVYDRMDEFTYQRLVDYIPIFNGVLNQVSKYPSIFDTHWHQHIGIKRRTLTGQLRLEYERDGWSLNSTTAMHQTKQANLNDQNYRDASLLRNPFYISPTATPLLPVQDIHPIASQNRNWDFSQELRLTTPSEWRIRGTLGASFLFFRNPGSGTNGIGVQGVVQNTYNKTENRTPAVFGAIYYDFTERLTLSLEGRYQWDRIKQQQLYPIRIPADWLSGTFTSFSPRVSLDYKYSDNSLAYVLFSRGYRPGGFNTALIGNLPSVVAQFEAAGAKLNFQQEKLDNFEAGLKSSWIDNRLQTTLAIYKDKWNNGQISNSVFVFQPNGQLVNPVVVLNLGKVTLQGLEAEARFAATEHLQLAASFGYQKNTIDNYVYFPDGNQLRGSTQVNGNSLNQSPKFTWSFSPQYNGHLFGEWDYSAHADITYRGKYFIDLTNVAWVAPLILVNARFAVTKDPFKVEVYVVNLFNNKEIPEAVSGGCCHDIIGNNLAANAIRIGVPYKRTFGIKGTYTF